MCEWMRTHSRRCRFAFTARARRRSVAFHRGQAATSNPRIGRTSNVGAKKAEPPAASNDPNAPYEIVDTPGSTYLLNKANGQVWRLSFTDVGGNKYWYALHVPLQTL